MKITYFAYMNILHVRTTLGPKVIGYERVYCTYFEGVEMSEVLLLPTPISPVCVTTLDVVTENGN